MCFAVVGICFVVVEMSFVVVEICFVVVENPNSTAVSACPKNEDIFKKIEKNLIFSKEKDARKKKLRGFALPRRKKNLGGPNRHLTKATLTLAIMAPP